MKLTIFPWLLTVLTASAFAACGGSTSSSPATPAQDSGVTADGGGDDMTTDDGGDDGGTMLDAAAEAMGPLDHGAPSTTYPAFKPAMAQLADVVGAVLNAPVIVPITWETDPLAAQLDDFSTKIGATAYWHTAVNEYGVGAATAGTPVHMPVNGSTPLPSSFTQASVDAFVATNAGAPATSGWPAPTPNTIYILYLHPSTVLKFGTGGQSACQVGIGGYHTSTQMTGVSYAIVPRCGGNNALAETTGSASHELLEAATDPAPNSSPAYVGFTPPFFAWELLQAFNVENGDACEFYSDSFYTEQAPFSYQVQRVWSNASAAAGHNPCVPLIAAPYFNVTPVAPESVTVDQSRIGGSTVSPSKGFKIPVGTSKTFGLGFFSDAATSAWSIRAAEGGAVLVGGTTTHNLTLTLDKTSGRNGEIAYLTVKVNTAGSTVAGDVFTKANFVTIVSSMNNTTHYMPILITN